MIISRVVVILTQIESVLDLGFINLMCDVVIGGTHQTMLLCTLGLSKEIPASLALFICNYIPYEAVSIIGFCLVILLIVSSKKWTVELDNCDLNEFKIYKVEEAEILHKIPDQSPENLHHNRIDLSPQIKKN